MQMFQGQAKDCLIVFFAGWGMDPRPFLPMLGAVDVLLVWDYTHLPEAGLALPQGRPVHAVAWSMGVWAAQQVLAGQPVASATAVNGTPWPIDDERGIPEAVFRGTLEGFSEAGLARFRRRMCGGAAAMQDFLKAAPERSVEDLRGELAALGAAIRARPDVSFPWSRAIACMGDRIFPLAAQQAAFPQAEIRPGAHWAPEIFRVLLRGEKP